MARPGGQKSAADKVGSQQKPSTDAPEPVAVLEQIFSVVLAEARARPAFAKKLAAALPGETVLSLSDKPRRSPKKATFNPLDVNPVVIVRSKGETALKFELGKRRTKKDLLAIIRVHNLDVEARLKRSGSLSELRQAIIQAAVQRIERDRAAAS